MPDKALLILCDGMRPDLIPAAESEYADLLMKSWRYNDHAQTVFPSFTLPCHMSLFQSQKPDEHQVIHNVFVPVEGGRRGLFEQLWAGEKTSGFFYSWGELKDLYEPYSLSGGCFLSSTVYGGSYAEHRLTEKAVEFIHEHAPDFVFLYLENTDIAGHTYGWGSPEYLDAIRDSFDCIEEIVGSLPAEYSVIITADHGGHELTHGTNEPIDMTIPVFIKSEREVDPEKFDKINIIDIAPSICDIVGAPCSKSWRGGSVFQSVRK